MIKGLFLIIIFSLQLVGNKSARILAVYPTPSISHQVVFRSLTDALVNNGHHVTVITTDPKYPKSQAPKNLTEIDVHDLSYDVWLNAVKSPEFVGEKNQIKALLRATSTIFKLLLTTREVQDVINKNKREYDLILLEAYIRPGLIFSHIFKTPVILVSSFGAFIDNFKVLGLPNHPFLYPILTQRKLYNLSLLEKLHNLYRHWWFESTLQQLEYDDNEMLKSVFGPNTPCINQLSNNIGLLFLNIHPIWMGNQPVPPNVVFIGGIHTSTQIAKDLPKDLQTYMDKSKNGVIYFSLGTNVHTELLPSEKIQIFIKVFSQLPYNILWKWNQDTLPGKSENIKISQWLPQPDLLHHPNIKLFITQGGLQSTDEAIAAGVPLIGIPMLAEQWYNVQKYDHHGIGTQLDMDTLTEDELRNAINKVINDKNYRENIRRLHSLIEDQPMSSLQRGMWYIEHILRHGNGKHLRAAGANISWNEYLELDLVLLVASVLFFVLVAISIFTYLLSKLCLKILRPNIKIKET